MPGIDHFDCTAQIPAMPSDNPQIPIRPNSIEEKEMLHEISNLAGAPNFNAWAMQLLRIAGEEVLKAKAPDRLPVFMESRKKAPKKKARKR